MRFITFYIALIISHLGFSQPTVQVAVDKLILQEGERLTYQVTMNRNCEFVPPKFNSFEIIGGPFTSSNSSYSNYNGNSTQSTTYVYTYYLKAKSKGVFTIEAPTMNCGKEKTEGQEVKIEVVENGDIANVKEGIIENYIELKSNKSEVLIGEPFIVTSTFYSSEQPTSIQTIIQGTASNLWRSEMTIERLVSPGKTYYKVELSKEVCIANEVGELTIEPYSAILQKEIDFFNVKKLEGISNRLVINVLPLPKEEPENFNELVGKFELIYAISKTSVKIGEAIDLDITIKGTGNFDALPDPVLNLPESFHVYDPEVTNTTTATEKGLSGEVKYKFVIVPSEKGSFTVLPYSFSYYDLSSKSYKSASTEELELKIKEGSSSYGEVVKSNTTYDNSDQGDILPIDNTVDDLFKLNDFSFGSSLFNFSVSAPFLCSLALIFFYKRKNNKSDEDVLKSEKKNITRWSLKELESLPSENKLTALRKVMDEFFMVKLDLSRSQITKSMIATRLKDKGCENTIIEESLAIISLIDQAAYAPLSSSNVEETILRTKSLITALGKLI